MSCCVHWMIDAWSSRDLDADAGSKDLLQQMFVRRLNSPFVILDDLHDLASLPSRRTYPEDPRTSAAQTTAASARSCCGTGPSSWPPSAMNSDPVEKLAASEATNSTNCVISSGSAMRGIAKSLTAPAPTAAASDPPTIGVRTLPGWMELTRILSRASSSAAVLVNPRTPHLLAPYAASPNV